MSKLEERLKKYWKESSAWKKAGDIIFYIFITLMIIPQTRKPLTTSIIRLTMHKPKVISEIAGPEVQPSDYEMLFRGEDEMTVSLEDFKGEVVLLNFWATWCPPCRAEMPSLQELYNDYGDKIKMLLVTSEKSGVVNDFLREYEYDLPVYYQLSPSGPSFQANSIPTTYLVSKNGRIVSSKTGAANWNSDKFRLELDQLIAE